LIKQQKRLDKFIFFIKIERKWGSLMLFLILSGITAILLIATVFLDQKRPLTFYFAKPMTTLTIISVVLTALPQSRSVPSYAIWILAGLVFSLIGDIALMFETQKTAFLIGLGSFFMAHTCYLTGIFIPSGFDWWDILIFLILMGGSWAVYRVLRPNLNEMKIPVIAYIIIILLMVERAVSAPLGVNSALHLTSSLLLAIGAVLFWISDLVLALHLFHKPNPKVGLMNLVPYFTGQLLIALSARFLLLG